MDVNNRTYRRELGSDEHEYTFNGVKYIVSSRFEDDNDRTTLTDRVIGIIKSGMTELTKLLYGGIISGGICTFG